MRNILKRGEVLTLLGNELKPGEKAPDFTVIDKNMQPIQLSDFAGRVVIINAVPSLDTPVCNKQIVRFNQEAALLHNAVVLSVSMDLPFALDRFCGTFGIQNVKTTSDYKFHDFGKKYGVLIEELQILTRAVFVIDKEGILRYVEYVPEISELPDFDKALAAVHQSA